VSHIGRVGTAQSCRRGGVRAPVGKRYFSSRRPNRFLGPPSLPVRERTLGQAMPPPRKDDKTEPDIRIMDTQFVQPPSQTHKDGNGQAKLSLCIIKHRTVLAWPQSLLSLSMFLWSRKRPVRKADNLTAICDPIVYTVGSSTFHNPKYPLDKGLSGPSSQSWPL
jgi:hypothetical protein